MSAGTGNERTGAPTIRVNGRPRPLEERTVCDLLVRLGYAADTRGIAVAVNGEVVPRGDWKTRGLCRGDEVEIVGAVQGG